MSLSQMRLWQNRSSRCSLPTGIEEESGKGESLFLFPFIVFLSFIAIFVLYHTRKLDHRQERGGGGGVFSAYKVPSHDALTRRSVTIRANSNSALFSLGKVSHIL